MPYRVLLLCALVSLAGVCGCNGQRGYSTTIIPDPPGSTYGSFY